MLTQRNTSWGTRASDVGGGGPALAVAEVVGDPGDCGLPLLCEPGTRTQPAGVRRRRGLTEREPVPDWDAATRRDWLVGVLAVPVSMLPMLVGLVALSGDPVALTSRPSPDVLGRSFA